MRPDLLLAHDLGTSGNKATLFSSDGKLVKSRTQPYDSGTRYSNGCWADQRPADWIRAVCLSTRELLDGIDPKRVACVSLSGQMMGTVPLDADGNVLHDSLIYCDQRSEKQAKDLATKIDPARFYQIAGHRLASVYALTKIMWLRDERPDVFQKMRYSVAAKDYVNFFLTGKIATDYSDASGTNAFDLAKFEWSSEILDAAGIDRSLFPDARPSTEILGEVTREASEATGLAVGTPVALGGGDGSCAGVGVGSVAPGVAYNYLGTSAWIGLTVEKPLLDPGMRTMTWAHCVPGLFHATGSVQTAGSSYAWLKNTICVSETEEAKRLGVDVYEAINAKIAKAPVGSNGVVFLPYMLGERSPRWNANARGAFIGLNLGSTREDVLRSVLEGVTMNLGLIVRIFREQVAFDDITAIGGGAKGAVWRQILADVYDCPIKKLNALEEATSMGAAIVGGVACGMFDDFSAIERFVAVDDVVLPNPENRKIYEKLLPIFDRCYFALVDVYEDLARFNG